MYREGFFNTKQTDLFLWEYISLSPGEYPRLHPVCQNWGREEQVDRGHQGGAQQCDAQPKAQLYAWGGHAHLWQVKQSGS